MPDDTTNAIVAIARRLAEADAQLQGCECMLKLTLLKLGGSCSYPNSFLALKDNYIIKSTKQENGVVLQLVRKASAEVLPESLDDLPDSDDVETSIEEPIDEEEDKS